LAGADLHRSSAEPSVAPNPASTAASVPPMPIDALTLRFIGRELRNRYLGSFSGAFWLLVQPLLQLAIYSFVFVHVFKARLPGADAPGYVPFLVAALWPWTAFADAVQRSATAIQDNAALIGKVAVPRQTLVVSAVSASMLTHLAGFVAMICVLALFRDDVHVGGLVPSLLVFVPLYVLALGIGLICAAFQVFIRDLAQALVQILMLLMFCAPIFYDRAMLPERFQGWIGLHPFTFYADSFRALLLHRGDFRFTGLAIAALLAAAVWWLGRWAFRRLDPHFEDFL
jgi:lipopolysaccharide transport system permease protein